MNMNRIVIYFMMLLVLSGCNTMNYADKEVAAKNKKIASINISLGMAYLEHGDKDRARQKLLHALQRDPSLPEAWYSMGYFQEATGHTVEARKNYLHALELAPDRGDVQNNYGTFLCRSGYYQEAVNHFITATKDPQYLDLAGAYENAGLCSLKIPDKKQAERYFNLALEQDATREVSMTELTKLRG